MSWTFSTENSLETDFQFYPINLEPSVLTVHFLTGPIKNNFKEIANYQLHGVINDLTDVSRSALNWRPSKIDPRVIN